MRLTLFSALACAAAFAVAGCVPSLHPLCTDSTAILDDRLVGFWETADGDCVGFQRLGDNRYYEYVLPAEDAGEPSSELPDNHEIRLVEVGRSLYMDFYPKDRDLDIDEIPAHLFVRAWLRQDELHLSFMDADHFADLIKQKKIVVKHETLENGPVLTAGTAELRQLLALLDSDPEAFLDPFIYKRRSAGPCP